MTIDNRAERPGIPELSGNSEHSGQAGRKPVADRDEIITAAWKLFENRGYEATTMTDVAEVSGISRRSLFNYFETKEALLYPRVDDFFVAFKIELDQRPLDESLIDSCSACLSNLQSLARDLELSLNPGAEVRAARLSDSAVRYSREKWAQAMQQVLADRIAGSDNSEIKAGFVAALVAQIWTEATKLSRLSDSKLSPHQTLDRVINALRELLS